MFMPHVVTRLEYGRFDLASLVPNLGGYEPDPVKRIRNSRAEIGVPPRPPIDLEKIFKKLPMQVVPAVGGLATYGEF